MRNRRDHYPPPVPPKVFPKHNALVEKFLAMDSSSLLTYYTNVVQADCFIDELPIIRDVLKTQDFKLIEHPDKPLEICFDLERIPPVDEPTEAEKNAQILKKHTKKTG